MPRFDTALFNGIQTFTIRKTSGNFFSIKVTSTLTNPNSYSTRVQGRIPQMVRPLAILEPTIPTGGGLGPFESFAQRTVLATSTQPQPVILDQITTARGCSFINAIVSRVSGNTIFLSVLVQVTFNTVLGGQRIVPFTVEVPVRTRCRTSPTDIRIQSVECRLAGKDPQFTSGPLLGVVNVSIPLNILATVRFDCLGIFRG
ncbi:MAG: hypothetical protein H0Z38_06890 [Firmicutes bacterium]|nr:hypothetical protein [Bacillota bacterium]